MFISNLCKIRDFFNHKNSLNSIAYKKGSANIDKFLQLFHTNNKAKVKVRQNISNNLLNYITAVSKTDNPVNAEIDPLLFLAKLSTILKYE